MVPEGHHLAVRPASYPNNNSRFSFLSTSVSMRHRCYVPMVYSGVCSSYVDVLQVSMAFNVFFSAFFGGEMYIQNMTHAGG